jgi:hypothetical protein
VQEQELLVSMDPLSAGIAGFARRINGLTFENRLFVPGAGSGDDLDPAGTGITAGYACGVYWYRIVRHGSDLSMSYSFDGINYADAGAVSLSDPADYNQLVLSGMTDTTAGSYADYDYIYINSFDTAEPVPVPVPEPAGMLLMSAGLIGLAVAGRRKFLKR